MNVEDLANRISLPHLVSFFLDAKGHVWAIAITLHLPSVVSRLALFIFHIGTNLAEMIFVFYKYSVHLDQAKKKRGQHEQFWFCLSETWKNVLLWNYWANFAGMMFVVGIPLLCFLIHTKQISFRIFSRKSKRS